jgi:hypothetical protein
MLTDLQIFDIHSTMARSLRDAGTDFDRLLFDRLRAFHSAADIVDIHHPRHHALTNPSIRWHQWNAATSQLVLDLLRDTLAVSRSLHRPAETVRFGPVQAVTRPTLSTAIGRNPSTAAQSSISGGTANGRRTPRSTGSGSRSSWTNGGSARSRMTNITTPGERYAGSRTGTGHTNLSPSDVTSSGIFANGASSRCGGTSISGGATEINFVLTDAGTKPSSVMPFIVKTH